MAVSSLDATDGRCVGDADSLSRWFWFRLAFIGFDTGPYGIVRHPIYTGIIVATIAVAMVKGTLVAVAGALMHLGYWIKAQLEEGFLREQLGAEAYDSYRRRVPMLVPFGRL